MTEPDAPTSATGRQRGTARARILAATLAVVADEGVDAVTHRAVAVRAHVSPGSTTHHFASREDLLREAFRFYLREAEKLIRDLDTVAADRGVSPLERVRRVLCDLVEREFDHESLVRAEYELLLYASRDPDLAADVRVWEARLVTGVAAALEASGVGKPVAGARMLVNLVRGFELERLLDRQLGARDFEERLSPVLQALCSPVA